MEGIGEQKEMTEGNEEYQSKHDTPLMPDAPRFDMTEQTSSNCPTVQSVAERCDESEDCRKQAFVPRIHTKPEWLQQIEYGPNGNTIDDAVSQPVLTLLKRICSGKE